MELYRFIDEMLYREWDPVGVGGLPEARDEYYAYLPEAFARTLRGESVEKLANYLNRIETSRMGLSTPNSKRSSVAKSIVKKKIELGINDIG